MRLGSGWEENTFRFSEMVLWQCGDLKGAKGLAAVGQAHFEKYSLSLAIRVPPGGRTSHETSLINPRIWDLLAHAPVGSGGHNVPRIVGVI